MCSVAAVSFETARLKNLLVIVMTPLFRVESSIDVRWCGLTLVESDK